MKPRYSPRFGWSGPTRICSDRPRRSETTTTRDPWNTRWLVGTRRGSPPRPSRPSPHGESGSAAFTHQIRSSGAPSTSRRRAVWDANWIPGMPEKN